jgi:ABC-type phosphate/phosphonate transport system substrate-binding protein
VTIRLVSYLSPGLPEGLFEAIGRSIGKRVGAPVDVEFVRSRSGPSAGRSEPFDGPDLIFVCGPSYVELRRRGEAALVPSAPVFADPRNGGRTVYFFDVVVAARSGARRLDELRDRKWAVNDDRSLSGFGCVIAALGPDVAAVWSGGHDASVEMVLDGSADCASVDANYLRRRGTDGLRVVHTFGPHPIQPLVARPSFERVDAVVEALCARI